MAASLARSFGAAPGRSARKVVCVTANRVHAERDRAALKRLPLEVDKIFASATQAYNYLLANPCDIVFCDHDIKDLAPLDFVRTLKASPSLRRVPVVMVTLANDRADVLDAVAAGCAGYILRPYADDTFEKHCKTALQLASFNDIEQRRLNDARLMLETGDLDEAIEEFGEVVSLQGEAKKYYDLGCDYLTQERYGKAIVSFQKAIRINDLFAEAYEGLAEAFKRRGDMAQSQAFLKKAAALHAEADRMDKVKELFIDILKMDEHAVNPFNTLGVRLRKAGDVEGAIQAYTKALQLTPQDENIYYNLAKACFFKEDPAAALDWVAQALRINANFPEALKMYARLKGSPWPASPAAASAPRENSRLLKDDFLLKD